MKPADGRPVFKKSWNSIFDTLVGCLAMGELAPCFDEDTFVECSLVHSSIF